MSNENAVLVVGLGEVGKPLLAILSQHYRTIGVDVVPPAEPIGQVEVMHICFPFEIRDFVGETVRYIERYKPALTIINSTIAVGTTRQIGERSRTAVVHSPVRGKHARMLDEMAKYAKFVGGTDTESARLAASHFESAGLKVRVLASPEATELAKLTETTYFGLMIAWAQEVERYCDQVGASYDEVVSIYDEIHFFPPVKYFPGVIGGHCVIPNIKILSQMFDSAMLQAIERSNKLKVNSEAHKAAEHKQNASADMVGAASIN